MWDSNQGVICDKLPKYNRMNHTKIYYSFIRVNANAFSNSDINSTEHVVDKKPNILEPHLLYYKLICHTNQYIHVHGQHQWNKIAEQRMLSIIIMRKAFYKHQMLRQLLTVVPVETKKGEEKQ